MALVTKNDVTQIFAIQAPSIDLPPTFANYPRGWDTARSNNGKPTIKQFNYIQQRTDQNVLWIHQNGAALPYDAAMEYAENAVVVKDGELHKKQGAGWVPAANKGYNLDYFVSGKSYPLHAEIMLANGGVVKSTVPSNIVDPNVDMAGWIKTNNASQIFDGNGETQQEVNNSIKSVLGRHIYAKDFAGVVANANYYDVTSDKYYTDSTMQVLSNNDTAGLKSAILYALNNNLELIFSAGNYLFNNSAAWFVSGNWAKDLLWVGNGAKIICPNSISGNFAIQSIRKLSIWGLDFEGIKVAKSNTSEFNFAVTVYGCITAEISQNSFVGFAGDQLSIHSNITTDVQKNPSTVNIHNNIFDYTGRGGLTITGCVVGDVYANYIDKNRVDLSAVTSGSAVAGAPLHVESDQSARYGIEKLVVRSNIVFGFVNISNPVHSVGYVGDKDTVLEFHSNKIYHELKNDEPTLWMWGGNHCVHDNEFTVTIGAGAVQTLGNGVFRLACNSIEFYRNKVNVNGRQVMFVTQSYTYNTNGKYKIYGNEYIGTGVLYMFRQFNKISTYSKLESFAVYNEDYKQLNSLTSYIFASDFPNKLKLKNIVVNAAKFLDSADGDYDVKIYSENVNCTGTVNLPTTAAASKVKFYYKDCNLGTFNRLDAAYPVDTIVAQYFSSGSFLSWNANSTIGKSALFEKVSTGVFKFSAYSSLDLKNMYSTSFDLIQDSADTNVLSYRQKFDANNLVIELRNSTDVLTDPTNFCKFGMYMQVKKTSELIELTSF